jgi:hypothetical protein
MPDPGDPLLALVDALSAAIASFNSKKAAILKAAFEDGGDKEVEDLLEALDDLRNARSDLILRRLDTTAAGFAALADDAKAETVKLENSIERLKAAAEIINTAAGLLNLLGRIFIRFGL